MYRVSVLNIFLSTCDIGVSDWKTKEMWNKDCRHWNILDGLSDWNIVSLKRSRISSDNNDDMVIITVLKGVKATISKNMLNWVYGALIVNDGTIYRYYIV